MSDEPAWVRRHRIRTAGERILSTIRQLPRWQQGPVLVIIVATLFISAGWHALAALPRACIRIIRKDAG